MRGHLAAARIRVVFRADGAQEHFERRHAEGQAERPIPVVWKEPVVSGTERHARCDEDGFVAGTADLEEDQALVLELNLFVVNLPRQHHDPVGAKQIVAGQSESRRTPAVADCRTFHARNPFRSIDIPQLRCFFARLKARL